MRKRIKRDSNNKRLIVDIIFYLLMCVLGYLFVEYENFNLKYDYNMISCIFFILAFLSSIAFVLTKKKGDYEYLITCLVNFAIACYIYNTNIFGSPFVLGDAILVYALCTISGKLYITRTLWKKKDPNFLFKIANSVVLICLSFFAVYSLYSKEEVSNMIIGYYLIGYGLLCLLEPITTIILRNPHVDNLLISTLKYVKEENTPPKKLKEIKKKKIQSK